MSPWWSNCFDVFSLNSRWRDPRECETQTFTTGHVLNLFCEGQTKCVQQVAAFPVVSLPQIPCHQTPWPCHPLGDGPRTPAASHIHTPSPCVTGLIIRSLACKRGRVIQVSIPEPPLGSRIRRQKTVRDTEGCQSDIRQQHTSPPRKGRRVGLLLANRGLVWLWLKRAFVAVIPEETEGGETNCF